MMTVHINEYSTANIFSLTEVADNIVGVHINIDNSKEIIINTHMQYRHIFHFIACAECLFYTNLDETSMVTNPINTPNNPHSFLSTMK